jgi:N-acetylglutamate synthase-like GNAT family acetyltransferase
MAERSPAASEEEMSEDEVAAAENVGLITVHIGEKECEITTLDSLDESIGVGTALVEAVENWAREAGIERLWLVTTNDNLEALKFWQKRGYELVSVHRNAIADARRIKPQIPITGLNGITIRDEIELEKLV